MKHVALIIILSLFTALSCLASGPAAYQVTVDTNETYNYVVPANGLQDGVIEPLDAQIKTNADAIVVNAAGVSDLVTSNAAQQVEIDALGVSNAALGVSNAAQQVEIDANTAGVASNASSISAFLSFPIGMIIPFAATNTPTGWLYCDGAAVSRVSYAPLFAVLGETWGEGDGATSFNLPDFRGLFLRGIDPLGTFDEDYASRTNNIYTGQSTNGVGSIQLEEFASHTHDIDTTSTHDGTLADSELSSASVDQGVTTGATGGNETRPDNAAVRFLIKY